MRIKNKELRRRRHRKEQVVKAAQKEIRKQFEGKPAGTAVATVKSKSPAASKKSAAEGATKAPRSKAAAAVEPTADKPKKAPKAEGGEAKKATKAKATSSEEPSA